MRLTFSKWVFIQLLAAVSTHTIGSTVHYLVPEHSVLKTNFTPLINEMLQRKVSPLPLSTTELKRGFSTPFPPQDIVKKKLEHFLARLRSFISEWDIDFVALSQDLTKLDTDFWNAISLYRRVTAPTDELRRLALFTSILFETIVDRINIVNEIPPAKRRLVSEIYKAQILVLSMNDSYGYPDLNIDWYAERVISLKARFLRLKELSKASLGAVSPVVVEEVSKQLTMMEIELYVLELQVPKRR